VPIFDGMSFIVRLRPETLASLNQSPKPAVSAPFLQPENFQPFDPRQPRTNFEEKEETDCNREFQKLFRFR
jgi:hypothetical protein